jgi:hypothetical protein
MELDLSKQDDAFREELRSFIADNYPWEMRVANPATDLTKEQGVAVAQDTAQRGVDRTALAQGVWSAQLVDHATLYLGA